MDNLITYQRSYPNGIELCIEGVVNRTTIHILDHELSTLPSYPYTLLLNMAKLTHMNSDGIRRIYTLAVQQRNAGRKLTLTHTPSTIHALLQLIGLHHYVEVI